MKIKTKQPIKDLKGQDMKGEDGVFTIGVALANILGTAKEGGKMKLFILAQDFFKKEVVDVDEADLAMIKKAVETTEIGYNNLVTGQILLELDKLKN